MEKNNTVSEECLRVGCCFSGGGLGDFGFELAGMQIAFQIEIDEYCQKLLKLRWPDVPKYKDIKTVRGKELPAVDVICGGFPCQPFSVAGNKRGKDDDRYLWPPMRQIISEVKPSWVVAENVPGIVGMALDDVLSDLETEGYEAIPIIFPAHALGAPHKRDRVWIVAHARCAYGEGQENPGEYEEAYREGITVEHQRPTQYGESGVITDAPSLRWISRGSVERENQDNLPKIGQATEDKQQRNIGECGVSKVCKTSPDTQSTECEWISPKPSGEQDRFTNGSWWQSEPGVDRVVNGMSHRVDRLKVLGNGQVVQATYFIARAIMNFEKEITHAA
jgi:DNA (cytosine-5)-methyltransferase 1